MPQLTKGVKPWEADKECDPESLQIALQINEKVILALYTTKIKKGGTEAYRAVYLMPGTTSHWVFVQLSEEEFAELSGISPDAKLEFKQALDHHTNPPWRVGHTDDEGNIDWCV